MKRIAVWLLSLSLFACSAGEPAWVEVMAANPMANPTLSFMEPTEQRIFEGSGAGLVGTGDPAILTTVFEFNIEQTEQVLTELLAQAEAAGFRLERRSSESRLPEGSHVGKAPDGVELELRIIDGRALVRLR